MPIDFNEDVWKKFTINLTDVAFDDLINKEYKHYKPEEDKDVYIE